MSYRFFVLEFLCAMTPINVRLDMSASTDRKDPMERMLPKEPIEPMEKAEPREPIDMKELRDHRLSTEFFDL